jgi:signal peptidase I
MTSALKRSWPRELFETIIISVILVLFCKTFIFQQFRIPTGSMEDTLLVGDHLMVNKFIFGPLQPESLSSILPVRDVRRGDVVVFKYPEDPDMPFIKRVIGLPGENVEIRRKQVYIDGVALEEPYKFHKRPGIDPQVDYHGPVRVPEAKFFVLGDNRDNSRDSRFWGFVPEDYLMGRALLIWWSYEERRGTFLEKRIDQRVRNFFDTAFNFFSKTRWRRSFTLIR